MPRHPLLTDCDELYGFPGKDRGSSGTLSILNLGLRLFFDLRGVFPRGVILSSLRRDTLSLEERVLPDGERVPLTWSAWLTRNRAICLGDPLIQVAIRSLSEKARLVTVTDTRAAWSLVSRSTCYPSVAGTRSATATATTPSCAHTRQRRAKWSHAPSRRGGPPGA